MSTGGAAGGAGAGGAAAGGAGGAGAGAASDAGAGGAGAASDAAHPCASCGKTTTSKHEDCKTCRRLPTPCLGCGTLDKKLLCKPCFLNDEFRTNGCVVCGVPVHPEYLKCSMCCISTSKGLTCTVRGCSNSRSDNAKVCYECYKNNFRCKKPDCKRNVKVDGSFCHVCS